MTEAADGSAVTSRSGERDAFVQRALIARLLAEQAVAELAHLPLGGLAVLLTWSEVDWRAELAWFAALTIATFVRIAVRRRAAAADLSHGVPTALRVAVVGVAAVWGVGIYAVSPYVPPVQVGLLLLIICGLTAAATSTLLADPRSYAMYTGGLLTLAAGGTLRRASQYDFRIAFVIVVFYGFVMALLYVRLRRVLLRSLNNEHDLEQARGDADRERAFLDLLFRSAPEALVVVDQRHCVLRANPAFERLFGYSFAEARAEPLDALILPAREADASREFRARIENGSTVQTEARRRRRDGSEFDARISAVGIESEAGAMLVIYENITERKQAERALRDSEARLFRTLASLPVGIMVIDPDGIPFFVNDAATQLLGQGLTGGDPSRLASTYHAYIAGTDVLYPVERMPIIRALAGEESSVDDIEVRRPDDTINLEVFGSPIRGLDGKVAFGVAAFLDITERRRIADALEAARIAAEEATASKSAFLANMSHEIRTPLNGILGMAELLLEANLSAEDRRSVQLIMGSGETLLHVINDILDFSKIEAGQLDIERTEVDVPVLIESTVRLLVPKASASGVEMVIDIAPDVPVRVIGDPTRLRQVLANLVGNAVKFTARGEIVVQVERLADEARGTPLRFSVRDTGTGIPADKLSTIFEAFRQADATTTRRYGGTGLGLSISRRLVELMGGELTVQSTEGSGSVFTFTLVMPVVSGAEAPSAPRTDLAGARVMIVDDNATNRRAMRGVLVSAHAIVGEAADGRDALQQLRDAARSGSPFTAVVTDLLMPDFDGFDLAQAVRADPELASLPIVLATSVHNRGDSERCRELGISARLLKPTSRDDLLSAVRAAIGAPVATPTPGRGITAAPAPDTAPEERMSLRVLLAEDNVVNQEVASTLLRRRGHSVVIVDDGRAAVDAIRYATFDVVLMDLQMPELDGLEATAEIRALPEGRDVRIVALTANAMPGERERCLRAGMNDYIAKPFKSVELLAAVENRAPAEGGSDLAANGQPVDLHGLRADLELGGVADIMGDILGAFVADSPSRMDALRAAVASGDARSIDRAAHAFKSGAATIRARGLADLLQVMEREARAGSVADASARLAGVEAAYAAVREQLATTEGTRPNE